MTYQYKKGKKQGTFINAYSNGGLQKIGTYKEDKKHGTFYTFFKEKFVGEKCE